MKRIFLITIVSFIFLLFTFPNYSFAIENPLANPNNKFGIHILFPEELEEAKQLVNSNGGDYGYVLIPIQIGDKDLIKWQNFMDEAKLLHLIPIVRLATEGDYFNTKVWRKPTFEDVLDFSNFLNSLNWPTKNRYIVVFNEPNRGDEWGGIPDPYEYANILNYTVSAFKSKNENFFIISAGLDNAAPTTRNQFYNEYEFLRQMDQGVKGIFSQIDGLGSHSYPNPAFSKPPSKQDQESVATFKFERDLLKQLGGKDLPVFITETGWSRNAVPDSLASEYYKESFLSAWADENIVAIMPFLLKAGPPFDNFSLINTDGSKTLSYKAIESIKKIAGKPTFLINSTNSGVLGNSAKQEFETKNFESRKINNFTLSISKEIKSFFKWLLKI